MVCLKGYSPVVASLFFFTLAVALEVRESGAPEWGYEPENGPLTWSSKVPQCGGARQSPININRENLIEKAYTNQLLLWNHGELPSSLNITNNGHTVQGKATFQNIPFLTGGPLGSDQYVFEQVHFHWGSNNLQGSEHTFNDGRTKFPMEMHMVHFNKKYGDMTTATSQPDGLAVVGLFFQRSMSSSRFISTVANSASGVANPGSTTPAQPTPLLSYPDPVGGDRPYYHYKGSLTTPPCSESVTWILYPEALKVTDSQLERLRSLKNPEGGQLEDNFRNTQPLSGRTVEYVRKRF